MYDTLLMIFPPQEFSLERGGYGAHVECHAGQGLFLSEHIPGSISRTSVGRFMERTEGEEIDGVYTDGRWISNGIHAKMQPIIESTEWVSARQRPFSAIPLR